MGPESIVDDAEIRHLRDNPILGRVEPGNPLSSGRVLSITETVPDPVTDI